MLACGVIAACAIDSRVGRVDMSPSEASASDSDGSDDSGAPGNTGNSAEGSGAERTAPGAGTETSIAPVLPPPGDNGGTSGSGSGASSTDPATPGSMEPGAPATPGPGAGGAGTTAGLDAPPPATEPEVIGGCFNQLLSNGDFERGSAGWTVSSELRDVIVWNGHGALAPTGVAAQSGNYLAWIGGLPSGDFTMYRTRLQQEVAIPAETLSLTFSGYVWAAQPELGLQNPDWAILELADPTPDSTYLWRVQYFEDTQTAGWVRFEETWTDVSRFAGKTVPVQVHNMPNGNGLLSVWLDSLRLEARCPR